MYHRRQLSLARLRELAFQIPTTISAMFCPGPMLEREILWMSTVFSANVVGMHEEVKGTSDLVVIIAKINRVAMKMHTWIKILIH
jgi:hypothetical protein